MTRAIATLCALRRIREIGWDILGAVTVLVIVIFRIDIFGGVGDGER